MGLESKILLPCLLYLVLLLVLMPRSGFKWDIGYWTWWTLYMYEHGLGHIYEIPANYQPLYLYWMQVYCWFQDSAEQVRQHIYLLKIWPLLFDFLPVGILLFLRKRWELKKGWHWFLLFNIAYLYNTLIWAQVDSVHSNLSLLAVVLAFVHPVASAVVFWLAFNAKIQAGIFLPLLVLIWLFSVRSWKQVVGSIALIVGLEALILLPFILAGAIPAYLELIGGSVDLYPVISQDAYNFWDLALDYSIIEKAPDSSVFFLFSYKTWGLILFFVWSGLALFPLFLKSVRILFSKRIPHRIWEQTFLTGGLVALLFFYVNTQMHERYSHPAMVFLFFYGVYRRHFGLYVIVSLACFLNMERVMQYFQISYHTLIFEREFVAGLFGLVLLLGFYRLFSAYGFFADIRYLRGRLRAAAK